MISLLAASFVRLRKSRIFWAEMLFIAVEMVFIILDAIFYVKRSAPLDSFFLYPMRELGLYIALFADIFLGTEYRDNAIRNKFMGGHSRTKIYLSLLISCYVSGLLFFANYILTASILGLPFCGTPLLSPLQLLTLLYPVVMMIGAFSSIFTMAAMLASGRFILALPSYALMALLSFMAGSRLNAPQVITSLQSFSDSARPADVILQTLCQFLWDFLPAAQSMQLETGYAAHPLRLSLYSVIIMLCTTLTGILLFRRKDIA